ncbi:MAG: MFS transporter [Actinomycetota bacterium]
MVKNNTAVKKDRLIDYVAEFPNFFTLFMFSFFLMAPSTILIEISSSLNITPADFSLVFTFFTVGLVIGQLTANIYNRFLSRINLVSVLYMLLMTVSAIMFFISNLYLFYGLYFLVGYLLGILYIKANQYILESKVKNRAKILTIATTFFPVGAILTPVVSVWVVASGIGWRYIYLVSAAIFGLIFILYQLITRKREYDITDSTGEAIPLKEVLKDRKRNMVFLVTCMAIFSYAVAETVISTWAPTFFREMRSFDVFAAGFLLTVFWLAIIIGRLISSYLTDFVHPVTIIFYLAIMGTVALYLMLQAGSWTVFIFVVFTGFGFSAIFPLLVYFGSTIYKQRAGSFLPALFVAGTVGNAAAPYLTSITSRTDMTLSIFLALIFMAVTLALITVQFVVYRKKK